MQVHLKDPNYFPHKRQYPLKPEIHEGLKPIINSLKTQGLLITCNSPCNTPILGVQKPDGSWHLVQDLRAINEAVVPLHPIVPNPYSLLSRIPEGAAWFTVLDLKDAFFCILLAPESQFLFAFEDSVNPSAQLTWTIFPQGFRDSPHLFGQVLAKDLAFFD